MQVGQFPAGAANSLIQGYCDDFVSLAAILAQTLEQVSMRGLNFDGSRPALHRIEDGMRNLAEAIHELLDRGRVTGNLATAVPPGQAPNAGAAPAPAAGQARTPGGPTATRNGAPPAAAQAPARGPVPTAAPGAGRGAPTPPAAPATPATPAATNPPPRAPVAPTSRSPSVGTATSLRQVPPRPAAEGIKGTSQSMPVLSVFQFLGRMRKAGTMRVILGAETLTFELHNGCILGSTSSQPPHQELLAELLVARGHGTAERLAPIADKVDKANNERFGELVIQAGLATEAQVVEALEQQAASRYARVCKSPDARYEFLEGLVGTAPSRFRTQPITLA